MKLPASYAPYPKVLHELFLRFGATPEELAAWVWMGPNDGGLKAYLNANELDPPPRFHFAYCLDTANDHDYLAPLVACWFRTDEIAQFSPVDRYITGSSLIERWSGQPGLQAEAFIKAKIRESRLEDMHPICGGTQAMYPDQPYMPPLGSGLFLVSKVEAIEAEDFPADWRPRTLAVSGPGHDVAPPTTRDKTLSAPTSKPPTDEPLDVFLRMAELRADELSITFVGDRSDTGLGANNMLEIVARSESRRVALASLDLLDRRNGTPNSQAVILLGMVAGRRYLHSASNAKKMTRLRKVLSTNLGLTRDPFQPYGTSVGWVPLFKLADKRGAAEDRARREGELRTSSFEELAERGIDLPLDDGSRPFDEDEPDAATNWLRQRNRGESA